MLKLTIPTCELYDEEKSMFINIPERTLSFEHSLASISQWESKWHIPFLDSKDKTIEQRNYYYWCMCLDVVELEDIRHIPYEQMKQIDEYIEDPMTATWINDRNKRRSNRIITAELVYCWMFNLNIPLECEKWNFNKLCTLIKVCNLENSPPQKMGKQEVLNTYRNLNAARKAKLNTKG